MQLTGLGKSVLVTGLVAAIAGLFLGTPALIAVGCFLAALVGLASLLVVEVPDVEVARRAVPAEVERDAPATINLRFRSRGTRPTRALAVIEHVAGRPHIATVGPIIAQGSAQLTYAVDTDRRGVVLAGPLTVRRYDPFGLVTADRRFASTCSVSVRPRRLPIRMLPTGRQRDLDGPTQERSAGSATFLQLRDYVPGDDLRRIHWRTTARTGTLVVKHMVDTTRPELVVVLDNRSSAVTPDDFEHAVDIAASIVGAAEDADFPVALLFVDGSSDADTKLIGTGGHEIPSIDRLTAVQVGPDDSLGPLAEALTSRGRSLVFITGEPSTDDLVLLTKLAHGFSPAILVSVVGDRRTPVVAPRGMRAIACSGGAEFAELWSGLR